jgi:hypothetical protein
MPGNLTGVAPNVTVAENAVKAAPLPSITVTVTAQNQRRRLLWR